MRKMQSATAKYGQYSTFAPLDCKNAVLSLNFWFLNTQKLGTVQHFCYSGLQKCCTVPKFLVPGHKNLGTVQHFCSSGLQKCCTVPKFLVPGHKNLGTVQHFCSSGLQKYCTVPKIFGLGLKSAVLSLKNLKNLFSRTFRLGRP